MATKITLPDGTIIESDVPEDAADAAASLTHRNNLSRLRAPRSASRPSSPRKSKAIAFDFADSAKLFIAALMRSASGMNTDQVAAAINIKPRSIPPVLRSIARWAQRKKMSIEDIIDRKAEYVDRKPVTHYRLTDRGKTELAWAVPDTNGKPAEERIMN